MRIFKLFKFSYDIIKSKNGHYKMKLYKFLNIHNDHYKLINWFRWNRLNIVKWFEICKWNRIWL